MPVTTITVNSTDDWIDTGIDVLTSQLLHISASGFWSPVVRVGYTDPDGFPSDYVPVTYPSDGIGAFSGDNFFNLSGNIANLTDHWGALCGFIGTPITDEPPVPGSYDPGNPDQALALAAGARIFLIGSNYNSFAPDNGRLYIRSSDDAYTATLEDNDGSITVYFTTDTIPDNHTPEPNPICGDIYLVFPFNPDAGGALRIDAWRNVSGTYHLVRSVRSSVFTGNGYVLGESIAFDSANNLYIPVRQGLDVYVLKLSTSSTDHTLSTVWTTSVGEGNPEIVLDVDQNDIIYVIVQNDTPSMAANLYTLNTSGTVLTGPTSIGPGSPASHNEPSDDSGVTQGSLSGCAVVPDGSAIAYSDNYSSAPFADDDRIRRWDIGGGSQMADLFSCPEVHGLVYDIEGNLWAGVRYYYEKYEVGTDISSDFLLTSPAHRFDVANTLNTDVFVGFEDGRVRSVNRFTTANATLFTFPINHQQRSAIAVRCAYPFIVPSTAKFRIPWTTVIG